MSWIKKSETRGEVVGNKRCDKPRAVVFRKQKIEFLAEDGRVAEGYVHRGSF